VQCECGRQTSRLRLGWCGVCFDRWWRSQRPPGRSPRDERMRRFAELARYQLTDQQVAWDIGVSRRTIVRYRKALRDKGSAVMPDGNGVSFPPIPDKPPPAGQAEEERMAHHIAACARAHFDEHDGRQLSEKQDALLMAEALKIPRSAMVAAQLQLKARHREP
jgi:biotin operon repressor